jgi:excisionase family DNA binding protein
MTLESIRRQLIALRELPEHDESTFESAASLVHEANSIAAMQGTSIKPVGRVCNPIDAIAIVSSYIQPSEWLTVPQVATLIGVSQAKVAEWIHDKRLDAINVANKGKRGSYRINRNALNHIKPEQPKRQTRRIISDGGIDI